MGVSPVGEVYSTKRLPLIGYKGLMEFYKKANKTNFLSNEVSFTTMGPMFSNVSSADIYALLLFDDWNRHHLLGTPAESPASKIVLGMVFPLHEIGECKGQFI